MKDQYNVTYGIRGPNEISIGLSSLALNPKENFRINSTLDNIFRKYLETGMYSKTGISFTDLMAKPRHEVLRLFELLEEFDTKRFLLEEAATNKAKAETNRTTKNRGNKPAGKSIGDLASIVSSLSEFQ